MQFPRIGGPSQAIEARKKQSKKQKAMKSTIIQKRNE
jgi:hypothetical protein